MKYYCFFILIVSSVSCSSKVEKRNIPSKCDCPLELIFTKLTYKEYSSETDSINFSGDIDLNPMLTPLIKKILNLEMQLGLDGNFHRKNSKGSESLKVLDNLPEKELLDAYSIERQLFCAKYAVICKDETMSDTLKTTIYFRELEKLNQELRKIRLNKKDTVPSLIGEKVEKTPMPKSTTQIQPQLKEKLEKPIEEKDKSGALIVTYNQSGGSNTVVNPIINVPDAKVEFLGFDILNLKTDKIQERRFEDSIKLPSEKIKEPFVYLSKVKFSYVSELARNELIVLINRQDVLSCRINKNGRIMSKSGKTPDGRFAYVLQQPENGLYTIDLYLKAPISKNVNEPLIYFK